LLGHHVLDQPPDLPRRHLPKLGGACHLAPDHQLMQRTD
jgi:hypothetical protein